ncbi:hypothetical protein [Bradyrhizobium sp. WYCCWR 12699]|uniref:hypothetical protein n=1 Tax=Bradyrhizobium sp. WYCCWR 12699 TaxID=3064203 RepID=UPI0028A30037|nr:hypothetical protein [Bradyrhizobium sp. WYCCWR 12699]MDT4740731.1 hypothetical protein [Bradyrhizobium sp. WYCCWR 12699]
MGSHYGRQSDLRQIPQRRIDVDHSILTISESEKITARIFERIAKLEFDVAAHDVIPVVRDRD